jgi:hypothetical protein
MNELLVINSMGQGGGRGIVQSNSSAFAWRESAENYRNLRSGCPLLVGYS